jgi:uncharacterized protein (DUF433 family)
MAIGPASTFAELPFCGVFGTEERIVIDAKICHGKPVVRGTRTPVTVILDALAGGDTFDTIMEDYQITTDDIRACLAFCQ